ncbi:MAG: DUF4476 domain-containing protein [Chitinophagales bacterium]|nr:DUF4476 domain-containing protein [Chitinophagales bacterium]
MRKIFTLFTLLLTMSVVSMAQSEFFLKINKGGDYIVYLDNDFIKSNKNEFRFFDINTGYHQLRIEKRGYYNSTQVVYKKNIYIKNNTRVVGVLNNNNQLNVIKELPLQVQDWYLDVVYNNNNMPSHVCNNYCPTPCPYAMNNQPQHVCNSYCPTPCPYHQQYPNYPNNYPNHPNNYPNQPPYGNNNNYPFYNIMPDNTFNQLEQTLKNTSFDSERYDIGKTALKNANINTNQVIKLINTFSFDSKRVEFAKLCYDKTVDKQNYFQVVNAFSFNSSKKELTEFINSK